jgi:hypothetical protein
MACPIGIIRIPDPAIIIPMPAIFISYRREDSAGYAGRLHEELAERFGPGQVFRDVDTLRPGQDFEDAIRRRLEQCNACVVMIGPGWLKSHTADGQRRLGAPGDYVTMEIAAALVRPDAPVVPVLVGGATMPSAAELPEVLQPLARRHALTARDETWEADMDRLAAVLRPSVSVKTAPATSPRAGSPTARYAVPALIVILLAGAVMWYARGDAARVPPVADAGQGPSAPADPGRDPSTPDSASANASPDSPAYAIDVPPGIGEVAQGDLIYAVVAGSVQRRASGMRLWLRIRLSNEGFYSANFWDNSFRLVAGGQTIAPNGGLNDVIDRRSIQQGVVRFDLPTVQRTATLRISNNQRTADLPIDLSGNGAPPKHEEQDPRDALSHAVLTSVVRNEFPLIAANDVAIDVMRISRRAFVNTQRITAVVKWSNKGRYGIATGDLTLRLAAGGEVLAPFRSPSEVVEAGATYIGDVVFEVPPQITRATLRAELRGTQKEQELTLRTAP